ncbi:MAG: tetratricopeptide (TPR) repeat protein [Pseudoalteromonas tetraodonis]|jgi:tetratricopeptide (TPR) repeat protein
MLMRQLKFNVGRKSRWRFYLTVSMVFCAHVLTINIQGHEDTLIRIAKINETIAQDEISAKLLHRRARLYEEHCQWDRSLADYRKALREDPDLTSAHLGAARCYLRKRSAERGLVEIDRFLDSSDGDQEGLLIRARLRTLAGRLHEASSDYHDALEVQAGVSPKVEIYFEWASQLKKGGNEFYAEALKVVDTGLKQLGQNVALQELAIELELASRDYPRALNRVEILLRGPLGGSPRWTFQRAEILEALGKPNEALDAYQHLVERIHKMPARRQNVTAIRAIKDSANRRIAALASR